MEHEERDVSKGRSLHHGHTIGYGHGPVLKHGRSIDWGASGEHPHLKEWQVERGRSRECRCMCTPDGICLPPPPFFHSTPVTLHHTSTDSLGVQSFNMSRGSLPLDRGSMDTEMLVSSTGMVTLSSVHQLVSSSGPPTNVPLDAVLMTSGLTKE